MASDVGILCATAVAVGFVHTLLGPDHSVPFVAMSRAGGWSIGKTLWVTAGCGLAHVAGSVVIGLLGLMMGAVVMQLEALESLRGDAAGWVMIGFGLAYLTWGLMQAARTGRQSRVEAAGVASVWTPWILFLVFVLGPCEPLIPLLIYPAARASPLAVVAVVVGFTLATVVTMMLAVLVMRYGVSFLQLPRLERFSHAFAGLAILVCGLLVRLGL
jgi:sulfite exporter TauE/SafE